MQFCFPQACYEVFEFSKGALVTMALIDLQLICLESKQNLKLFGCQITIQLVYYGILQCALPTLKQMYYQLSNDCVVSIYDPNIEDISVVLPR